MCGIAGVIGGDESAPEAVRPMIEALKHRGPDGIRVEQVKGATLGHARLSIIDLECGWQPLTAAGSTVIGNGEIYNYKELIEEFQLHDQLNTGSDFEPLLHLYAREGEAAFARLRGMYAFCLVGCDGRTWLVRDPFGIKPLYGLYEEEGFAFASEPRAFVIEGAVGAGSTIPPRMGRARAEELLTLGYTLTDPSADGAWMRLVPGRAQTVEHGRWGGDSVALPAVPPAPPAGNGSESALERLDQILEDSVRVHQRSDVPYGLFLSGGVDSAAVAAARSGCSTLLVERYGFLGGMGTAAGVTNFCGLHANV